MDKIKILHGAEPLDAAEAMILASIKQIKYGEVKITVHDSRVVQLETTEKVRFKLGKELERDETA